MTQNPPSQAELAAVGARKLWSAAGYDLLLRAEGQKEKESRVDRPAVLADTTGKSSTFTFPRSSVR
jgi:hypothetical protein